MVVTDIPEPILGSAKFSVRPVEYKGPFAGSSGSAGAHDVCPNRCIQGVKLE